MNKNTVAFSLLFLFSSAFAAPVLTDIDTSDYKEAIYFLQGEKVIDGYEDGTFRPNNTINRAEFLKILIQARYERQLTQRNYNTRCFDDIVDNNIWYVKYACFARDWGIISGYEGKYLKADKNINVVEAAKIINKVYGSNTAEDIDIWYRPYMKFMLENNFIPLAVTDFNHELTRAEMAEMITRAQKQEIGQLDDYLAFRKTTYKEDFFPTWEEFGQTESKVDPEEEEEVKTMNLIQVVETDHPGERITGGYISNYNQWNPASYPATLDNNTISTDRVEMMATELIELLNEERRLNEKPLFTVDKTLTSITQEFVDHLVINAFYSHSDKYGNDPFERAKNAGYNDFVSESIVWRSSGPSSAVDWWKKSSIHWNNIMNEKFTNIGIGIAQEPTGGYIIVLLKGE